MVERSDVVILSVRPGDWDAIDVGAAGKLVISVMAGVTVEDIKKRTGSTRVGPRLAKCGRGDRILLYPVFLASSEPQDGDIVSALFRSCGEVDAVTGEEHIDYFTAMSGSGPAFPALLADAMMNGAVGRGVPSDVARRAAQQVIVGAGRLQEYNGASPSETVKSFVDYKGTTAAGIIAMRENGFDGAIGAGLEAAFRKAFHLSASVLERSSWPRLV